MAPKTAARKTKDEVVTVRLSSGLRKRLDALAEATDRSNSFLVAEAVENYVELQEWQVAGILEGIRQADAGELVPHEKVMALLKRHGAR